LGQQYSPFSRTENVIKQFMAFSGFFS